MARYKSYSYAQGKFIPVHFEKQIIPRTFEYSLNHLVDHELDLSIFDERYRNEKTGATAYDPKIPSFARWHTLRDGQETGRPLRTG